MRLLLKAGADPNNISAHGNASALTDAIKQKHVEAARLLLEAGADPNKPVEDSRCALHFAASLGNLELVQLLLRAGADVNARDWWGATPLHLTADAGSIEIARALIKAGAELNVQLKLDRLTPLMMAALHPECFKLLLEAGADVSLRNKEKQTVFELARKNPESQKLLEAHAGRK